MTYTSNKQEICSRCDVEMTLQPRWKGSESLGWYCPCCRSVLRTIALLNADADRRAEELGLTREQYEEHMESQVAKFIRTDPPTDAEMEHARRFAQQRASEWEPVCEHETENPWGSQDRVWPDVEEG